MSFLKQIDDKGAVLEWSPVASQPNMVALGTQDSAGSGFDDYGGELELHRLNFADTKNLSSIQLGKVRANSRFASIAWSKMASKGVEYPYGLIAGGMIDGTINIWDPARLASDQESLIACIQQHNGPIHGLQFNPHRESSHLLSSGGDDGEVYVLALDRPDQPNVFIPAPQPNNAKHTAPITKVAWNTQVAHILASSAQNGSCIVWDLRQKKAWCELRDPSGGSVSDIQWNPDQGLHFVTAGGDDKNPVIKLWDLRSSTSLPLATLQGHSEGILSMSWCPNDPSLLLSCGKDNRTILWDLFHLQPVYELPSNSDNLNRSFDNNDQNGGNMFGNIASFVGNRRYHVSWSPCLPAVISACSFDRSVQFYSLSGVRSRLGRAPRWLRKPVGASFGFGGKLAYFNNKASVGPNESTPLSTQKKLHHTNNYSVKVVQTIDNINIVNSCTEFHKTLDIENFNEFCDYKANTSPYTTDREIWRLMKVIQFEKNAREELLTYLGFNNQSIIDAKNEYVATQGLVINHNNNYSNSEQEDSMSAEDLAVLKKKQNDAEPLIRNALVVGNFSAAVDICIEVDLMTEALLLAQCGEPALWTKTQNIYFERKHKRYPFLNILQSVIKNDLINFVSTSDLSKWKETLALLSTYGKSEEFPIMCEILGKRLETEYHNPLYATLCFMCATNIDYIINFWLCELKEANREYNGMNTIALQEFIEKVIVYTHNTPEKEFNEECSYYFSEYAYILASQGKLDIAARYLKGNTMPEVILRDRLYHSGHKPAGSRPPPFPFTRVTVNAVVQHNANTVDNALTTPYGNRARAGSSDANKSTPAKATASHTAAHTAQHTQYAQQTAQHTQYAQQTAQQHNVASAQQHVANTQPQQVTSAAPSNVAPSLPAGWLMLVDPNSGRPYYVNQATGQSQWEPPNPPVVESVPAPVMASTTAQFSNMKMSSPNVGNVNPQTHSNVAPSSVSSAATIAAASSTVQPTYEAKADVSANAGTMQVNMSDTSNEGCILALETIVNILGSKNLSAIDRKQYASIQSGILVLKSQASSGIIAPETFAKLFHFNNALNQRNFQMATNINTDLVNTLWTQHKDWVKCLKVLIQMLSKY